jgi:hypothetical protein
MIPNYVAGAEGARLASKLAFQRAEIRCGPAIDAHAEAQNLVVRPGRALAEQRELDDDRVDQRPPGGGGFGSRRHFMSASLSLPRKRKPLFRARLKASR